MVFVKRKQYEHIQSIRKEAPYESTMLRLLKTVRNGFPQRENSNLNLN